MEAVAGALLAGVRTTLEFFWDSLFGLVFGFMLSAVAQVVVGRRAMHALLGPGLRGVVSGAAFGIVASACSYGAAAAARGFFRRGADLRSVFAFMISSTNMNVAIVVLFWALLGWKFAFAEFFGGAIIIAVVAGGIGLLFKPAELESLAAAMPAPPPDAVVDECPQCGMTGDVAHAVVRGDATYLCCSAGHAAAFRQTQEGFKAGVQRRRRFLRAVQAEVSTMRIDDAQAAVAALGESRDLASAAVVEDHVGDAGAGQYSW